MILRVRTVTIRSTFCVDASKSMGSTAMRDASTLPSSNGRVSLDDGVELAALVRMIWRRKILLACCVLAAVAGGAGYLSWAQPLYEVEARILVERGEENPTGENRSGSRESEQDKNFLATQAEILRSPAVLGRAIETHALSAPGGIDADPLSSIAESLAVSPVLGANVLRIAFRGPDAAEAVRTVNGLIESYRDYTLETQRSTHTDALRRLAGSEESLRQELQTLEHDYQVQRREEAARGTAQAGLTDGPERGLAASDPSDQLPAKLVTLVSRETAKEAAALPADSQIAPGDVGEPAPPGSWSTATIQEELSRAEVRLMELSQSFGPKHPDVVAVKEQIVAWKRLLRESLEAAAIQRVKAAHEVVLLQLQESRLVEAAMADGRSDVVVRQLEPPQAPSAPVWPPKNLLLAVCAAVGLLGGLGMVWLLEGVAR